MTAPRILQVGPYPGRDQGPPEQTFTVHRCFEAPDKVSIPAEVGASARAIATRGERGADRAMIEACPEPDLISVHAVGFDAVELEACRARGVRVAGTPDVLTGDVADPGVAVMLSMARGIAGDKAWVRSGAWAEGGLCPLQRRGHGCRAGILGLGRIGARVARRLRGFDVQVACSDMAAKAWADDLEFVPDPVALAERSDVLFVTLAATAATRHIVGPAVIDALGPEGMLVNISRASNIDEAALLDALETGRLGAAALDLFGGGEPRIDPRFLALGNVRLQPHHACGTVATRKETGRPLRENLEARFAGKPLPTPVS